MIAHSSPLTSQEQREIQRVRQLLLAPDVPLTETSQNAAPLNGAATTFVPLPPVQPQNGTKFDAAVGDSAPEQAEIAAAVYHGASAGGTQIDEGAADRPADEPEEHPMQVLIKRALAQSKRGRPAVFDERTRGKLVALLALGLSVRQSATVLGVSHPTILRALAADPELREEITAARYQAQLQPLGCVIREAQRSWRAATWLLKYMDGKLAGHEETPEEKRDRLDQEKVEDQIRCEEREAARGARQQGRQREAEAQRLAERQAEFAAMFPSRKRKPRAGVEGKAASAKSG